LHCLSVLPRGGAGLGALRGRLGLLRLRFRRLGLFQALVELLLDLPSQPLPGRADVGIARRWWELDGCGLCTRRRQL